IQFAVRLPGDEDGLYAAAHLPLEIAPPLTLGVAEAVAVPGSEALPRLLLRPGPNRLTLTGRRYDPALDVFDLHAEIVLGDRSVAVAERTVRVGEAGWREEIELVPSGTLGAGSYSVYLRAGD